MINNDFKNINNYENALAMICDQHLDKLSDQDKEILTLLDWKSILNLSLVNKRWSERLSKLKFYNKPEVEKFINLRDSKNLQKCLANNFKESHFINKAIKLVNEFYETKARPIQEDDNIYGYSFCMNPELLYYAMFLAKDEEVFEFAGGGGEHAALLAYSGAKHVYMNDITPKEVKSFKNLCLEQPLEIQKKLEAIEGDCLQLLNLKPELKRKIGLVLCNNLIHFFNDKNEESFMEMLKTILRPGGRGIFTVNATYLASDNESKETFERYPEQTSWKHVYCLLHDYTKGVTPISVLYHSCQKCPLSEISFKFDSYDLWLKNLNTKWIEDKSGYEKLPLETANKIKSSIQQNAKKIDQIFVGSVRLVLNTFRNFNENSLASVFKKYGFIVEKTFLLRENGHLYFGDRPYEDDVIKVGIIIKAPQEF